MSGGHAIDDRQADGIAIARLRLNSPRVLSIERSQDCPDSHIVSESPDRLDALVKLTYWATRQ
jgi:hypothetical protein